jgi:hypothetical protein
MLPSLFRSRPQGSSRLLSMLGTLLPLVIYLIVSMENKR